jgi:hypothetical protein
VSNCCESEELRGAGPRMRIMGDCCGGGFSRRYKTREEKVEGLEEYLKDLEAEASAVREAIKDLSPA